jgi:UDP-glucuronate decarboxylase
LIIHNIIQPITIDESFDEIYHLACPASPKEYQKDPIFTLDTNYLGTKNVLEFALKSNTKVLLTSTSEVYGDPQVHPQPESYLGNVNFNGIRSCYDEGKRIAETLMMDYHRAHNLPIRIARIFNTYGPKMQIDDGRVVSNFIVQALNNDAITIYGNGEQTRSFCYVTDLLSGLIRLMDYNGAYSETPFNIGSETELRINELALKIIKSTYSDSKIINLDLPSDDPRVRKPDLSKALTHLKWRPKIDFDDGITKTINYFKEQIL